MANLTARQRAADLAVLGLPAQATGKQVRHAYRRLVKATHPDVSGRTDADTADRLVEITAAYQRLAPDVEKPRPQSPAGHPSPRPASRLRGTRFAAGMLTPPLVAGPVVITRPTDTPQTGSRESP